MMSFRYNYIGVPVPQDTVWLLESLAEARGRLALYERGCNVGRYVSLERLVEQTKESYYETLKRVGDRIEDQLLAA